MHSSGIIRFIFSIHGFDSIFDSSFLSIQAHEVRIVYTGTDYNTTEGCSKLTWIFAIGFGCRINGGHITLPPPQKPMLTTKNCFLRKVGTPHLLHTLTNEEMVYSWFPNHGSRHKYKSLRNNVVMSWKGREAIFVPRGMCWRSPTERVVQFLGVQIRNRLKTAVHTISFLHSLHLSLSLSPCTCRYLILY